MLAAKWRLPVSIRNAIRCHNEGLVDGKLDIEVSCVHLANTMARLIEMGYAGDNLVPQPNELTWKALCLPQGSLLELLPEIQRDYEQSMTVFQLG
jgi:HD-like signal output (HDOD) protein